MVTRPFPRSRLLGGVLTLTLVTQLSACGTLFYPDRRGQIEGRIDPAIAVLDAVGLLFYVIPGLIAFGIDFATGAIYLPGDEYSVAPQKLQEAIGADGQIDQARLKAIIEAETGRSLPLDDPRLIRHQGSLDQLAAFGLRPAA
ncbi:polyribonucleotide nucleotidyltransferase [Stutzerimonas balearica]|uniref:polyribonucleotide nucleotidyltransferase n=1 Tax=Stutzerimonas balearica TaxID=74829 RepID=UPI0028A96094|nr:polyribonucleotide nucleotidyltransferase [Stutzerimonas balearica]